MKIVAFGDSITAAAQMQADSLRWPVLLQAALRVGFPRLQAAVLNAGVGGNTSREGLARMDRDVIAAGPGCVLVEFGGNDATPEPARRVPLEEFAANLAEMKARIDALGSARMVLLTFPPVIDRLHSLGLAEVFKTDGGFDAFIERYRQATRKFAAKHRLPLADLDRAIRPTMEACVMADGVHLTAEGNRIVAETVFDTLAGVLG
jgi:lysophospholipase L1-like esterase